MINKQNSKTPWWQPGLIIFARVSASIAVPVILALYVGKYLDGKLNTKPFMFLGLTFVSFLISLYLIYKNILSYIKKLEEKSKDS